MYKNTSAILKAAFIFSSINANQNQTDSNGLIFKRDDILLLENYYSETKLVLSDNFNKYISDVYKYKSNINTNFDLTNFKIAQKFSRSQIELDAEFSEVMDNLILKKLNFKTPLRKRF